MKRLMGERRQATSLHPDGPIFKERRKSYYHGKYTKQACTVLLTVTMIAVVLLKQGA